jgi:hypothetical protein
MSNYTTTGRTTANNSNISALSSTTVSEDGCINFENTGFIDSEKTQVTTIDSHYDETFQMGDATMSNLATFLSRPIKIQEYSWGVNGALNQTFNPWEDYFSNSAVQKKIDNFYLIRCKMNVMFKINASPFLYGALLASYRPLPTYNDVVLPITFPLTSKSQRPHVHIEIGSNVTECLCLPFFSQVGALRIPVLTDFTEMGEMSLDSYVNLLSANGGTGNITVSVYAFATDVTMSVPTTTASFTPQAGDEYDSEGVVSKPASTVASIASKLTSVPVIGAFAKATEIGASAIASMARLFGYSRPVNIHSPNFVRPFTFGNLASTDLSEPIQKLSVDSKQELCLDPRTVGLSDVDEMSIKYLAQKETFLGDFEWTTGDAPDHFILSTEVHPSVQNVENWTGPPVGVLYVPTLLSFASRPFRNWTGSIKFRFRIVASQYHRGRIRVLFDPYSRAGVSGGFTEDVSNILFNRVIDIATTRDFTVVVPWSQPWAYNIVATNDGLPSFVDGPGTSIALNSSTAYSNGYLGIQVLNELIGPTDVGNVNILMYISAGDDFKLRNPTHGGIVPSNTTRLSYYAKQSADDIDPESGDPLTHPQTVEVNPHNGDKTKKLDSVFFGESLLSLRQLLKRYTYHSTIGRGITASSVNSEIYWYTLPTFPRSYGNPPTSFDTFSAKPANAVGNTMLNYMGPAYAGWRGSVRYKLDATGSQVLAELAIARSVGALMSDNGALTYTATKANVSVSLTQSQAYNQWALSGMVQTNVANAPVLEADIPFQSRYRFRFSQNLADSKDGTSDDGSNTDGIKVIAKNSTSASSSNWGGMDLYVAAGDDFNFFFFVNAPPYFRYILS